LIIIKILLQQ